MSNTHNEIVRIYAERDRQEAKFGPQDYPNEKWLRVLVEEVGECAKEMNEYEDQTSSASAPERREYLERLQKEAIQVAAVAVAWSEKLSARIKNLT